MKHSDLPPWQMSLEEFAKTARRGKLHRATRKPPVTFIGSGMTPLSRGESEGYSAEDIAHFYVARRSAKDKKPTRNMIDYARMEYIQDAIIEGKEVPLKILADYPQIFGEMFGLSIEQALKLTKIIKSGDPKRVRSCIRAFYITDEHQYT